SVQEDCRFGMLAVERLERIANRFLSATEPACDPPGDLRGATAHARQPSGPRDDLFPLAIRELAEFAAPLDVVEVLRHEAIDGRLQKTDPLPITEHEPPADQPPVAPAVH